MTGALTGPMTELALFELLSLECRVCGDGSVRYYNTQGQMHRVYGPARVRADGSSEWYHTGQVHRVDGPAIEYADGYRAWWQNGKLHRLDGPANERPDGYRAWYQNGQRHRLDGPAIVYPGRYRSWYQNGRRHRLDGPAIEYSDGSCDWYINDKALTEAEWQQAVASMGMYAQQLNTAITVVYWARPSKVS